MIISKRLRAVNTRKLRAVYTRKLKAVYTRKLRAVYTLSLCLIAGSVNADFDSAAEIYRKNDYMGALKEFQVLAEEGDARAQTVLALMYKYGEGAPLDHSLSFHWYMKAAELNYAPAQYHAGIMSAEGLGVEANLDEAVQWLTRSAEGGYYRANDKLEQYNAARVSIDAPVDQYLPWSKHWDFSLPNNILFPPPKLTESARETSFRVQFGAMSSPESAELLWQFLTKIKPSKFAGFTLMIEESARTDQTLYRVQTGPFNSFQQAKTFCQALVDNQIPDCIPLQRPF